MRIHSLIDAAALATGMLVAALIGFTGLTVPGMFGWLLLACGLALATALGFIAVTVLRDRAQEAAHIKRVAEYVYIDASEWAATQDAATSEPEAARAAG